MSRLVWAGPGPLSAATRFAIGVACALAASSTDAQIAFDANATLAVGSGPSALVVGDLNGDHKPDVVVANTNDNTVSVLLGNGDGTFQPQVTYPTGGYPFAVALGDFDGNNALDIAVVNRGDNPCTVGILLGNGDGTFQSQQTYAVGSSPRSVAVGNFNADGNLDLAVENGADNTVSILLGQGNGTFAAQSTYSTIVTSTAGEPYSVAADDFDKDGSVDLVVANSATNEIVFLRGNGNGTFQPPVAYPTGGSFPYAIAVGHLDADTYSDLAVANRSGNSVGVLLGVGNGAFHAAVDYPTGDLSPSAIAIGDFNADGNADIVASGTTTSGSAVSVLLGNGNGTFQPQVTVLTVGSGSFTAIGAGVFRGYGEDLIVGDAGHSNALVLLDSDRVFKDGFELPPGQCPSGTILLGNGTCGVP